MKHRARSVKKWDTFQPILKVIFSKTVEDQSNELVRKLSFFLIEVFVILHKENLSDRNIKLKVRKNS